MSGWVNGRLRWWERTYREVYLIREPNEELEYQGDGDVLVRLHVSG